MKTSTRNKALKVLCLAALLAPRASFAASAAPDSSPALAPSTTRELVIEPLDLDKAITEVSKDAAGLSSLYGAVTEIYLRQQRRDKAISLLATYERGMGTDLSLLNTLANLYEQMGATDRAVKARERLVTLDVDGVLSENRAALSELYRRQGNNAKALSLAENLSGRDRNNPNYLRLLARMQQASNDWHAEETVKKVIALSPQLGDYQQLAEIYQQQKKYDEAIAALEEGALKLPKEEVQMGILKGEAYTRKGDYDAAMRLLNDLTWKAGTNTDLKNLIKADISIAENLKKSASVVPPVVSTAAPHAAGH